MTHKPFGKQRWMVVTDGGEVLVRRSETFLWQVGTSSPCHSVVWNIQYFQTTDLTFFCKGSAMDKLSPPVMVTGSCPVIPLVALQNRSGNQYRTVRQRAVRQLCQVTHVRISVILLIMEIHLNVLYCVA